MPTNNTTQVVRLLEEVWNKGHFALVDELIAPVYTILHDPDDDWEGKTLTRDEFRERLRFSFSVLPDQKFTIREVIGEGLDTGDARVTISWLLEGTHKGEVRGLQPTGNKIAITGMTIYYFRDGFISGHYQEKNQWLLMQQLGILG